MKNLMTAVAVTMLCAGCKVEVFTPAIDGSAYIQGSSGTIYQGEFTIEDSRFKETFRVIPGRSDYEFWYWAEGSHNFCGSSTQSLCALDSSFFAELPADHVIFNGTLQFNLVGMTRPKYCTPPAELRDLEASNALNGGSVIRLCEGETYEEFGTRSELEIKALYVDSGVTIKNSYFLTEYFFTFNASARVTMDRSEIWAGELQVKGLDLTNESSLVGGANIGKHSIEISEMAVKNSYFHLSASHDRTQSEVSSDSQSVTLRSIVATGDNTRITFSAKEGRIILRDINAGDDVLEVVTDDSYVEFDVKAFRKLVTKESCNSPEKALRLPDLVCQVLSGG